MTSFHADKYSHTPRRVFEREVDRQDVKREKIAIRLRDYHKEMVALQLKYDLMAATLQEIHDRLFKVK